jgi:hypothetical protein
VYAQKILCISKPFSYPVSAFSLRKFQSPPHALRPPCCCTLFRLSSLGLTFPAIIITECRDLLLQFLLLGFSGLAPVAHPRHRRRHPCPLICSDLLQTFAKCWAPMDLRIVKQLVFLFVLSFRVPLTGTCTTTSATLQVHLDTHCRMCSVFLVIVMDVLSCWTIQRLTRV